MNSPVIAHTAELLENFIIHFVQGRGLVAASFPLRIALLPETLLRAKSHPGVIEVHGAGGIGSRVDFHLANGEALYEIIGRAVAPGFKVPLLVADRKRFKPRVSGKDVEVHHFALKDLNNLADSGWPNVVSFSEEIFNPPHLLKSVIRVRNRDKDPVIRINLAGAHVLYSIILRHRKSPTEVIYIAERQRLKTADGIIVRLPTAAAVGRPGLTIN